MTRVFLFFLLLPSLPLKAQYLFEPYLGAALFGDGDAADSTTNHNSSYSSFFYGARLGYQYWGLEVGVDYGRSSFVLENSESQGSVSKDKLLRQDWGVFVGYRFPIFLAIWAKWIPYGTLKGKDAPSPAKIYHHGDDFKGSGRGLGLSWTGLPWISLNVEYRLHRIR